MNLYEDSGCSASLDRALKERNHISILLNKKLEQIGKIACEKGSQTSGGGAYCSKAMDVAHLTDRPLAEYLKQLFAHKRIGSFGEGLGHYKKILEPFCQVYDGYDGAPFTENRTKGNVKFLDLSVPQYGLPVYDIIIRDSFDSIPL